MAKMVVSDLPDSTFEGRRVFVRVDFNVPIKDGVISEDYRIRRTIPTIDYLIEKGAKVILASHLGRPRGMVIPDLSLRPVSLRLSELLGKHVSFIEYRLTDEVKMSVHELQEGEVMLLENLGFKKEKTETDLRFQRKIPCLAIFSETVVFVQPNENPV